MIVVKLSVGAMMSVNVNLPDFIINSSDLMRMLKAAHPVVIFQDIIEGSVFIDKYVNSLVADKLYFLFHLLLHLLF